MSFPLRMAASAGLVILAVWCLDSLVDLAFFGSPTLAAALTRPSAYEVFMRLVTGAALAVAVAALQLIRRRHHLARQELSRQNRLYHHLVESSPECIIMHRDRRIVFVNRKTLEFLGLDDPSDYIGVSIFDFILPEYHEPAEEAAALATQGVPPITLDLKVRTPDGQVADIATSNTMVDWEGESVLLTYFRDITGELLARRDMLASRERLQLALDAARDGVWDWDITSGRMIYNEAWAGMLGYTLEEISSGLDTWRKLIHPADFRRAQTLVDSHLQGTVPSYEIEVRLRHKKGHYIWVLDRGRVVERDEQGNPLRMTGTHRDITARKEAELALEIRNQVAEIFLTGEDGDIFDPILALIGETLEAPVGLFATLDPQARLHIAASRPRREDLPASMDAAISFDSDRIPKVFTQVIEKNRYYLSNTPLEIPEHVVNLDCVLGVPISNRDLVLGALYLANKEGGFQESDRLFLESLAGYIAPILQSHLRSEAKEAQLRQAQKMEALGALAGGIAHDFNNILQAIMGFTTLALEDAGQEGTIPGDLQRVLKATRRGQELVQRILLFSRRDEQKHIPMAIEPVVSEAINLLKPSIPATIEIRHQLDVGDAQVFGDPGQISQIVLNLATNAYHAMDPGGGVLEIDLRRYRFPAGDPACPEHLRGKPLVMLSISDTGVGMDEQTLARLFDPFFTTKQVGHGTGLGMSVVHGIVRAHQGDIRIDSELEIGTTVTVFLPLTNLPVAGADPGQDRVSPDTGREHRHIVLVDDESDITDLGKALLEKSGHRVTAENNGRDLLDRMEQDPECCDLVITDLTMPQITGFQLADRLARMRPDLPVILITGMSDQAGVELDTHPNIKGLIRKPFGGDILRQTVDRVFEELAGQREQ